MQDPFDTRPEGLIATTNKCPAAFAFQPAPDKAAPARLEWRGSGCILVVDDEDAVRDVVTSAVTMLGFTAKSASSGPQAISIFKSDPWLYALVLMDVNLPEMTGGEIIRNLRLFRPDIPVILMSGFVTKEALAQLAGQAISGFLDKPFTMEALASKLRAALDPPYTQRP